MSMLLTVARDAVLASRASDEVGLGGGGVWTGMKSPFRTLCCGDFCSF